MIREKNYYFLLDEDKVPVPCECKVWKLTRQRPILENKVKHRKIVTTFLSRHVKVPLQLFKTTIYDSSNHTVYIEFYDDYDNAVKGHRRIVEEHK